MRILKEKSLFMIGIMLIQAIPVMANEINRLNWVEISQTKFSTQIMFDFVNQVQCHPELIKETRNLNFSFPGMSLQHFDQTHVQAQLASLKNDGILKTIEISEKTKKNQAVNLALEFWPSRNIVHQENNTVQTKKNRFLIKWSIIENPHRLIVDIFIKEDLDKLIKKDAVLLYATNDTQHYDAPITTFGSAKEQETSIQEQAVSLPRIIIDPGHGGANCGTEGHYALLEKNITLDISRRVHALLKQKGHKSVLIRNSDKDVSLLDRVQLAHQLQGDLFVSIHANSAGRMDSDTSGLETFYLDGLELLPEHKKTGFACISIENDANTIKDLNAHMKATLNQSQQLAQHIQKSVIATLAKKNLSINDRGVKQQKFRVLLRTAGASMPASLIEVGFLTNRNEAKKLATASYRAIIAQGIFNGICSYLDAL